MKHYLIHLGWLVVALLVFALNGIYFEYCVSRDLPAFISAIAMILVIAIDMAFLIYTVKTVIKLLKL